MRSGVMEPESNPFPSLFFMKANGVRHFRLSSRFLVQRFEQLQALGPWGAIAEKSLLADFIFEKDKLFACLNLTDQELENLQSLLQLFPRAVAHARSRDLSAGHSRSAEKRRLKKKNVPGERAVSEDYLEEVGEGVRALLFFTTHPRTC